MAENDDLYVQIFDKEAVEYTFQKVKDIYQTNLQERP